MIVDDHKIYANFQVEGNIGRWNYAHDEPIVADITGSSE